MSGAYRTNGKQVLCDSDHFADAASNDGASVIAAALNLPKWLEARAARSRSRQARRIFNILADDLRAGLHED